MPHCRLSYISIEAILSNQDLIKYIKITQVVSSNLQGEK
jgi:hypothetical protein